MKAVLFDLDGTLLDTRDMILESFRYAYTKVFGEDKVPPNAQLLSLIGIPLRTQMEIISPEHSEELFEAYLESNVQIHDKMLKDFPGTTDALVQLRNKGLRMAVITSKRHEPAVRGLVNTGLFEYFELIVGSDDCAEHKPSAGPLLYAAEKMRLTVAECAYVGDSPYDMQAARGAEMYAVGALWGMFTKDVLQEAGAEVILSDISELPGLFE